MAMARQVRFERPGGIYHVINCGNYRSWIFESGVSRGANRVLNGEYAEASKMLKRLDSRFNESPFY